MKSFVALLFIFFILGCLNIDAQNITIILLRHAEKDVSPLANKDDPDLTVAGQQRAERLFEVIRKYEPEQIFSTVYKRAKFTAFPLAQQIDLHYRIKVQVYNPEYLDDFAAALLKLNAKCVVVVGHNTTTPMLANALLKQDKYQFMDDSEFNKIWIIKVKGKKITDELITY